MNPKNPLLGILCLLILPCMLQADDKPNIVLVMADDQGWGDMSYYNHPEIKTPNFDKSAQAGLRFDYFYAAAPVCSPTRASVMTGRHPNRMGVFKWGYPIRPQETTIAEVLQKTGYSTGHFGKWHLGSVRKDSLSHPGKNGFDHWVSAPNFYDNDPILCKNGTAIQYHGESSIVAAEESLKWIKQKVESNESFLAVVWFGSPHSPHRAAEEDAKLYSNQTKPLQNFYGEVTGMDRAYGMIRQGLDDLGIRKNTVLWYCSDNGALPKVGSSGGLRGHKGKVYEGGLRVPAIIEWPEKIKSHRVIKQRCNTCDIYPTLLEITGVQPAKQPELDGISLLGLIEKGEATPNRSMGFWDYQTSGIPVRAATLMEDLLNAQKQGKELTAYPQSLKADKLPDPPFAQDSFAGHAAWIRGDWKLHRIENRQGKVTWELYHLKPDPKETEDLIAAQHEKATNMKAELKEWLRSVVDSVNGKDY